jgi:predicted amidohydrolase YtcJ
VFSALVDVDTEFLAQGLETWLPRFSAAGITTVHDAGVQGFGQLEGYQLLDDFAKRGDLPIRVTGTYYWNDPTVDPLPELIKMREKFASDNVRVEYLKINMDGSEEAWNGLFTQPFVDKPEIVPDPIIPYDILNDVVLRADAMDINVVCHCYGDLAVRKLLDAVEAAIKVNPLRDRHNKVTHGLQVHPDDIARFAELGVTYESHGGWMALDPVVQVMSVARMGMDWVNTLYPIREIAETGANISLGSDWPAAGYYSEYRPLAGIQMAVTRQQIGAPDSPVLGNVDMRLTLEQALRANTLGAAYGMDVEKGVGSIEVGKLADLIVLEQNLFEVDPQDISAVKVLYTVMDGELVYEADE